LEVFTLLVIVPVFSVVEVGEYEEAPHVTTPDRSSVQTVCSRNRLANNIVTED